MKESVSFFEPERFYYTYAAHSPAWRIRPGQVVSTWTADSDNGDPKGEPLPRERRQTDAGLLEANPVTGPFYVEGAEPGDTLVVYLEEVSLNRPSAFGAVQSHLAVLGDDMLFVGPTGLKPPIQGRRYDWELDTTKGTARLALPDSAVGSVEIPTHPFLGCIGTAPRWGEAIHTVDARNHGGNLDCSAMCGGNTVLLPVNVEGALLMFGDAHAAQGDGELAGGALETSAQVRFHCRVRKNHALRWPRVIAEDEIITLASGRPLIDLFRIAWVEMILWLESEFGFDRWDALHVLSQIGRARPCNVVSPAYTVTVSFPRRYLPPGSIGAESG